MTTSEQTPETAQRAWADAVALAQDQHGVGPTRLQRCDPGGDRWIGFILIARKP